MNNQQAIDRLVKHLEWGWTEETVEAIKMGIHALEETKWIPCSERMPEEAYGCLVTVMDCEAYSMEDFENIYPEFVGWDGETWNDGDGEEIPFEVIAWMPLPKPYKEVEDGN